MGCDVQIARLLNMLYSYRNINFFYDDRIIRSSSTRRTDSVALLNLQSPYFMHDFCNNSHLFSCVITHVKYILLQARLWTLRNKVCRIHNPSADREYVLEV